MPRRRLASKLGLLAVVLFFGALILEGVARYLCRTDEAFRERCLDGDDYWISRWFAMRDSGGAKGGEAALLGSSDPLHRRDSKLGWVPTPNLRQDGITTNPLGMRGAAELPAQKRPGERRIVVLGDSFTFGEGVRDEEVWTAQLATRVAGPADVTLFNLGVMGYGLDQMCLRFEELGTRLAPDVVLLGLFGPDLDRNELTFRDDAKPRFVLDGDGLALDNVPVPSEKELLAQLEPPTVTSYAWAMIAKGVAEMRQSTPSAPKWELVRRILDRLQAASQRAGAKLVIAWFPAKRVSFDRKPDLGETIVAEWAAARGVVFINARETFAALGSKRFNEVWHGHWTPFGNEVVADAIAAGFAKQGLLRTP